MIRWLAFVALAACGDGVLTPQEQLADIYTESQSRAAWAYDDGSTHHVAVFVNADIDQQYLGWSRVKPVTRMEIQINPRTLGKLRVTFLHELGHVMGLEHSPDPSSVMYEVAPDISNPYESLQAECAAHACKPVHAELVQ